jgi:hypothetical protein
MFRFSGSTPLFSHGICSGNMLQRSIFLFISQGLRLIIASRDNRCPVCLIENLRENKLRGNPDLGHKTTLHSYYCDE